VQIRGITFYPHISGTKLIFLFNNDNKQIIQKQFTQNKQHNVSTNNNPINDLPKKNKINISYVCKTDEPIYAVLDMRKTDITDVYKLFAVEKVNKDGKEILRTKKMGIAYIPTDKCSSLCKNVTSTKPTRLLMKCQFIQDKNKWMPIEEELKLKVPTLITEIEKKMDIIEEADSDSE
jgi:hypothetical protein